MDQIDKALRKLSAEDRKRIKSILLQLKSGDFRRLDIKKLKGRGNIYRVRSGDFRIIYRLGEDKNIFALTIERRSKTTYRNL
jgi:mRNA-degrading endonuclease RelE of RelBE toxin-antitoxin system